MNANSIVNAVASVAVAHLAVKNTSSLMNAVIAYFVGGVVVHYVLAMVMGSTMMGSVIDTVTIAAIAYVFYMKYKLTGAVVAVIAPTIISMVLVFLGVRF